MGKTRKGRNVGTKRCNPLKKIEESTQDTAKLDKPSGEATTKSHETSKRLLALDDSTSRDIATKSKQNYFYTPWLQ